MTYYQTCKTGLLALAGALFVLYAGYQILGVVHGPRISIVAPVHGSVQNEDHITLTGVSTDIASISVNGHQIFTDQSGTFSEKLLLLDGYNVIEVRATDKFKRTTVAHVEVVHTESSRPLAQAH